MFLEPTGNPYAIAGAAENYSDPTTAWKRELYRMTGLNGTYASNWLTWTQSSNNQAVDFMSSIISGFSNIAMVRVDRATHNGYAAFVQFNNTNTRLQIGLYRFASGVLTSSGTSADFVDSFTANWSQVYLEIKAVGTTISATARWDQRPQTIQATISVTDTTYTSGDVGAACIIATSYINQVASWDPSTETLDRTPDSQLVCVGDSRTVTAELEGTQYNYEAWIQGMAGRKWVIVSHGIGGAKTDPELIADGSNVDALFDATLTNNIVSFWSGTNALQSTTGAVEWANQGTYLDARKVRGWKRISISEINRVIGPAYGVTQTWETNYQALHDLQVVHWPEHAEAYANLLAEMQLGAVTDTTILSDGLHPTSKAMQFIAPIVYNAANALRLASLGTAAAAISKTITVRNLNGDVATDLDSVPVLRDPGSPATYGVIRTDTGEIIIAASDTAAEAFTQQSTGVYTYDVTGLTAGVEYRAYVETVMDGATFRDPFTWTAGEETPTTPWDGYYPDRATVIRRAGEDNFNIEANLDENALIADEDVVEGCFTRTDKWIDAQCKRLKISKATADHYIAQSDEIFDLLRAPASDLARTEIYFVRGTAPNDSGDQVGAQMATMRKEAKADILEILNTVANDGEGDMGFRMVPRSEPTCASDENAGWGW